MTNSGVALHNCEGRHPRDPLVKKIAALLVPRGDEETLRSTLAMLAGKWGEPQRVGAIQLHSYIRTKQITNSTYMKKQILLT